MISSLKLSPVIACEHLRCQLDIKQIPALKQRSIIKKERDESTGITLDFIHSPSTLSRWSVCQNISKPGTKYSGGGGISIKFSKMVFLYKCGSNFSVYAQRFKFRASTKVILPRAGLDLDPLQTRTWFSNNFLSEHLT